MGFTWDVWDEINIAPEKCWLEELEDDFLLGKVTFQGLC